MKKVIRFFVFAVAALTMCMFVGCGECEHKAASEWTKDATMHWHTCSECDGKVDVAGHTDANDDGACDVCAYADANHTHTYAEAWSADATNHWHAGTCFHTVKADEAAHTPNAIGECSVCGYKVGEPDLSTVAKAVALGASQKGEVKAGVYTDGMSWSPVPVTYEFHDDFTLIKKNATEEYYSLVDDETAFGVSRMWNSEWQEWVAEGLPLAVVENMWGPKISGEYLAVDNDFYGAEDLLAAAYDIANDNINGDFSEEIATEDGMTGYMFSFGYRSNIYGECLNKVQVVFTLDKDAYFIDQLVAFVDIYTYGTWEEVAPADGDKPAQYAPVAEAEPYESGMIYFTQTNKSIEVENPYSVANMLVTDYSVCTSDYEPITDTITVEAGIETTFYFEDIAPTTAQLAYATVEFSGNLVNNMDTWLSDGTYNVRVIDGNYGFTINALMLNAGASTQLTVSVNGVEKTYTVNVVAPVPTELVAGYLTLGTNDWGEPMLVFNQLGWGELEIYEGSEYLLGAYANRKNIELAVMMNNAPVNVADIITDATVEDEIYGTLTVYAVDLAELTPGTYEFAFGDLVNDLYAYATVVIEATPTPASILNNKKFTTTEITGENPMLDLQYLKKTEFIFTEVTAIPNGAMGTFTMIVTEGQLNTWFYEFMWDTAGATEVTYQFGYNASGFVFATDINDPDTYVTDFPYEFAIDDEFNFCIAVTSVEYEPIDGEDFDPNAVDPAEAIIGDWEYLTTTPGQLAEHTGVYGYVLTLNDNGTGTLKYDLWLNNLSTWSNSNDHKWEVSFNWTLDTNPYSGDLIINIIDVPDNTHGVSEFAYVAVNEDATELNGNSGLTINNAPLGIFTKAN